MYDDTINNALLPLKMCSAEITLDQYLPGWRLARIEYIASPQPRSFEHYIKFDDPFAYTPLVYAGISGFDIDNRDTGRLSVRIEEITITGFKLVIQTWMHTRVYMVEVSWFALGN